MNPYTTTAAKLVERIAGLVPDHPEILAMKSPWDLFDIPGFKCDDLGPSLAQAGWALVEVRQRFADTTRVTETVEKGVGKARGG